jgi:NTP pyrophosphatase (non-canonical NTP hydrolase)
MMDPLTFLDLRVANRIRCVTSYHPLDSWSLTNWATAVAGEVGEACNIIKKLRRLETQSGFARDCEKSDMVNDLAAELADAVIYIDLLAARAHINLGRAVRQKFNETSDRIQSPIRL